MPKRQKVKFHKGDRRPSQDLNTISYEKHMRKKGRKIIWQVKEKPTNNIIAEYFFEEDAEKVVKFQNKHRVWKVNGGIPKYLWIR